MGRRKLPVFSKVEALLKAGKLPREIVKTLGLSGGYVCGVRKRLGIPPFKRGRLFGPVNPEKVKAVLNLADRIGDSRCAKLLHIAHQQIAQFRSPDKHRARSAVAYALLTGKLLRPKRCSKCSKVGSVEGHHCDYSKPLTVVWLCLNCHKKIPKL